MLTLALWLAVSAMPAAPFIARAAPPESPISLAEQSKPDAAKDVVNGSDTAPAGERRNEASEPNGPDDAITPNSALAVANADSVRPRGLEAPVQLRKREPDPDPLDGEVERSEEASRKANASSDNDKSRERADARQDRGVRVWPMRADSYTFTQAFGCVPQIAHFYQPGAGCPASAPVIHHGVDLAAPEGTPFYAAASGWVTEAGYDREVGVANTRIIIQHEERNEDYATEYLHWIASFVEVGDYVESGEAIGEVGSVGYSTGPHLHFSVIDLNTGGNLDPLRWLPEKAGTEGYRGRRPNERARLRLPEGTTAGVPEWHDPEPPPPPVREDVPDSPDDGRSRGKRKRDRDERRDSKAESSSRNDAGASATNAGASDDLAEATNEKSKKGKNKERTRKRERNKNGRDSEKAANGNNSGASDDGKDSSEDANEKESKRDNRGGRKASRNEKDRERADQHRAKDDRQKERDRNKERNKRDNVEPVDPPDEGTGSADPDDDQPNDGGDPSGGEKPADGAGGEGDSGQGNGEAPPDDGQQGADDGGASDADPAAETDDEQSGDAGKREGEAKQKAEAGAGAAPGKNKERGSEDGDPEDASAAKRARDDGSTPEESEKPTRRKKEAA